MKKRTRQTIVDAAQELFSSLGYDGTSMESIAAGARVTKATVYRHFECKQSLFSAALQELRDELPGPASIVAERSGSLRVRLTATGCNLLAQATGSLMLRLHRMLAPFRDSAADTAEGLWDDNFHRYHEAVQQVLKEEQETGSLIITDTQSATTHFLSLIAGEPMIRFFLTGIAFRDESDAGNHVRVAVNIFLRAYGSGQTP